MRFVIFLMVLIVGGSAKAHQWLPTYPELEISGVPNVYVTSMELFNSRNDVDYYEIKVYDKDMKSVPFATPSRIVKVDYLKRKKIDVYIRKQDKDNVVYICSRSKLISKKETIAMVSSNICSKIK